MSDELDGKVIRDFPPLKPKTYTYLIDDHDENNKSKRHKNLNLKVKRLNWKRNKPPRYKLTKINLMQTV